MAILILAGYSNIYKKQVRKGCVELTDETPIAGNIKIGKFNTEKNCPQKLPYFETHIDKYTTDYVIEKFNEKYFKATEIDVTFNSEDPLNIKYVKYAKETVMCIGEDGSTANEKQKYQDGNKTKYKWVEKQCNEECPNRQSGSCVESAILTLKLPNIQVDGVWQLKTKSGKSIRNFEKYFKYLKNNNIDITKSLFRIFLRQESFLVDGENRSPYILSIRKIADTVTASADNITQNTTDENTNNIADAPADNSLKNYLMLYDELQQADISGKILLQGEMINAQDKKVKVLLDLSQDSVKELTKCDMGTVISVTKSTVTKKGVLCIIEFIFEDKRLKNAA